MEKVGVEARAVEFQLRGVVEEEEEAGEPELIRKPKDEEGAEGEDSGSQSEG